MCATFSYMYVCTCALNSWVPFHANIGYSVAASATCNMHKRHYAITNLLYGAACPSPLPSLMMGQIDLLVSQIPASVFFPAIVHILLLLSYVRRGLCDPPFFFLWRVLCAVQSSCTVLLRCTRPTHALHAPSSYRFANALHFLYAPWFL